MKERKPNQQEVQNINILEDSVQPDVEYKDFWRNPEHFADLFNGVCFNGNDVIHSEDLEETTISDISCNHHRNVLR